VALEKRLVDAYLLDAYDALERRQFNDPIDQQERIAMRQKFFDAFGVENRFHGFFVTEPGADRIKDSIQTIAALHLLSGGSGRYRSRFCNA